MMQRLRRDDRESYACYALFGALFVADFSLLAAAFSAGLFCYALLAQRPARLYWQARILQGQLQYNITGLRFRGPGL